MAKEVNKIEEFNLFDTKAREDIKKLSSQLKDIAKKIENIGTGGSGFSMRKVNANEIFTLDVELPKTFTVTNNLANSTNSNSNTSITEGNSYTATIIPNINYAISSITVTMNGIDVTNDVVSGNNINITNVTGNIVINVVTASKTIDVVTDGLKKSIYDLTSSNTISNTDGQYFNLNDNFTVFAKVVRHDSTSNGSVVLGGTGAPIGLQITYAYNVQVNFSGTTSSGSTIYPSASYPLASDMFRKADDEIYIAFIHNNKTTKLYINNTEVTFNINGLDAIVTQKFADLIISTDSNKTITWLYYNKALSTDELTQNYTALGGAL